MMRILSAIAFSLATLGLTLFVFTQQAGSLIRGEPSWELLAIPDAQATPEVAAKASRLLSQQPLDQAKLNLLFATEAKRGMAETRRARFRRTLYDLGWRDTATQQNLIVEAARAGDPNAAILHIDALLRRGRLSDQIVPILLRIEAVPQATELLAARLEKHPPWREQYLAAALDDPSALVARGRLLNEMLSDGDKLSRAELRASLGAMIRAGLRKEAFDIALRAGPSRIDTGLVFDPDFASQIKLQARDRNSPLPFEWSTRTRPGASVRILPRGEGGGQLQIRWSGNGAPIFARTMTLVKAGQAPSLEVAVDRVDTPTSLEKFRFYLACRGGQLVAFSRVHGPLSDSVVRYQADEAVGCDYPDLILRGHPQGRDVATKIIIRSIRLSATRL